VGFIFLLKRAIGETLKNDIGKESVWMKWLKFQSRIDDLALQAFDIYMDCREKICEIRIKQAKTERRNGLSYDGKNDHFKRKKTEGRRLNS